MQILQHYYTSFINRQTGNAGFQVKALSPELSPDAQSLITGLIAYRIPPTLDERALATHPVALRYYYENSRQTYLLCSQSNGPDENGRPGNFFAHTLILKPEDFKQIPPIFYWGSSFWQTKDSSTSEILDPLSPKEMISALEIEGVWTFLDEKISPNGKKRLEYFPKLMAAVIQAHRTHRRIVIIDSAENVALWIAAVSCMLPPDYRPLLSFATYHHDPYQSPFLITGTTSDSAFRATDDEYITFFILNTETDQVSDVDPSPYAEEAKIAGQSMEEYEQRLLSLFSDYVRRFPPAEHIGEQLDQLVRYARILSQPEVVFKDAELSALNTVLTVFEQSTDTNQEDVEELKKLHEILENAWTRQDERAIEQVRNRNVQLCQSYKILTGKMVMTSLEHASLLLWHSKGETAEKHLASVRELYGKRIFEKAVNNPEYWNWLDQNLKLVAQRAPDEWEQLARSILASKALAPLPENWENELVRVALSKVSLSNFPEDVDMCEKYYNYKGIDIEQRVVMRGLLAMKYGQLSEELSKDLAGYFKEHPMEEARSFILKMLDRPLKEQDHNLMIKAVFVWSWPGFFWPDYFWDPYWEAVYTSFVDSSRVEQMINVLEYWFAATPQTFQFASMPQTSDRDYIPQYFFLHLPRQIGQWQKESSFPAFAYQINAIIASRREAWQPLLQPLLGSKKNVLVSAGQNIGAVGLGLAAQLRRRFDSHYAQQQIEKTQAEQQWRAEFSDSVAELFKYKDIREAHRRYVQDTYQIEHRELFWECYWQHMTDLFLSQYAALIVDLLAFWFEDGYRELEQQLYLVPAFFLGFADAIDRARKEQRFGESAYRVHEHAQKHKYFWYQLVENYFIEPEREEHNPSPKTRTY
jgi:hypothetical protein